MAITFGTPSNSGNLTNASGRIQSHTTATNTKALVVIITGYDSSATDSVVSSVLFNNVTVPQCRYYRSGSVFIAIHSLANPYIGTANIVVTMGGTNTDLQVTAIGLISATADIINYDNFAEGSTANAIQTLTVSPVKTGAVTLGGIVDIQSAVTDLSVTTGTEIAGSEADMGSQVVGCATSTTATIAWTKSTTASSSALVCSFYEQFFPTVALDSPGDGDTGVSLTPTLIFTGTDANIDTLEYEVQVDTVNSFEFSTSKRSTTDPGFTPGHPYASGSQQSYTVQTPLLADTTYYWRVRAKDSVGSNIMGNWSPIRSFTTNANPSVNLDSPTDTATGVSTNPTLLFTPTDTDGNICEVQLLLDSSTGFDSVQIPSRAVSYTATSNNTISYTDTYTRLGGTFKTHRLGNLTGVSVHITHTLGAAVTMQVKIYNTTGNFGSVAIPAGNPLAESDGVDLSGFSSTNHVIDFIFSGINQILLSPETPYAFVVSFTGTRPDTLGIVAVIPEQYEGNMFHYYGSTYEPISGYFPATFYVDLIQALPLVEVNSQVDTGFSLTHPFASDVQVGYQVALPGGLSVGTTYYWKARAIDITGTNAYGPWSTLRSFTVIAGASHLKAVNSLLMASVKSFNTLLMDSVKKINSLE